MSTQLLLDPVLRRSLNMKAILLISIWFFVITVSCCKVFAGEESGAVNIEVTANLIDIPASSSSLEHAATNTIEGKSIRIFSVGMRITG